MKLDRETYEAWLLDHMEGRLSPAQMEELEAFLRANADLPASNVDLPRIDGGDLEFPMKSALRKDHPPAGAPDITRLDDFLVARSEKELSAGQEKELDRFLYEHPEAERQAAMMALAHVPKDPITFPDRATVERQFPPKGMPDAHRLTDFLIADLEGDLSAEQRSALKHYLAEHGGSGREKRLVAATRTVPVALHFAGKEGLKKREMRVVALWPRLVAAACFLLLLGAGWWQLREKPAEVKEVARVEKPVKHLEIRSAGRDAQPIAKEEPDASESDRIAPKAPRRDPMESPAKVASGATAKAHQPGSKPTQPPEQMPEEKKEPQVAPSTKTVPDDLPLEEPALVHQVEEPTTLPIVPEFAENGTAPQEKNAVPTSANSEGSNQDLGTYVANALRGKVLETPQRRSALDGDDALAIADKAISAVTGGQGGVEVEHSSEGQRFQLRLGRNFSVSASTSR